MNVYTIYAGERGEGGEPEAVALSLRLARDYVWARYKLRLVQTARGVWWAEFRNGVDEVRIKRVPLIMNKQEAKKVG